MNDPLASFDWNSLYERYDALCRRFDPAAPELAVLPGSTRSDRETYSALVAALHPTGQAAPVVSVEVYRALLYWKLYSLPSARSNIGKWLDGQHVDEQARRLAHLIARLPGKIDRDVEAVVDLVQQVGRNQITGMKTGSALPVRTTFLHYLYPETVPIFDRMVLQAVGVTAPTANQSLDVFREYLPFAWSLADRHGQKIRSAVETPVRLVDMALWVTRNG